MACFLQRGARKRRMRRLRRGYGDAGAGNQSMEQEGKRMSRDELVEEIRVTEQAMKRAGPMHYRDLRKHLRRMIAELKKYDRYQEAAKRGVG